MSLFVLDLTRAPLVLRFKRGGRPGGGDAEPATRSVAVSGASAGANSQPCP